MKFELQHVHFMPKELKPGILYVAEEFSTAAHLCACGCGSKIRTPLGPTEWEVTETSAGPSLYPSVGNWQQACKSHYWIEQGQVRWSYQWSEEQIISGRHREEARRITYYDELERKRDGKLRRLWNWLKSFFK